MTTGIRLRNYLTREILIRVVLFLYFLNLEFKSPFFRLIQPEEWWLYKYPRKEDNNDLLPTHRLFTLVIVMPIVVCVTFYVKAMRKANKQGSSTARLDLTAGLLSSSLALLLNGVVTDLIKNQVGRPRPDFFYRCFPDGNPPDGQPSLFDLKCTNPDISQIEEGRRSFPSGHSSFSFCLTVWLALYLAAKLRVLQNGDNNRLSRSECLLFVLSFPMASTLAAIGRTCDYKHHWQDVLCGSILGSICGWIGYRQFYPRLSDKKAEKSFIELKAMSDETEKIYDLGNISIDKRRRPSNV